MTLQAKYEIKVKDEGKRWCIDFAYSWSDVQAVKQIGGARFRKSDKCWTVPATLDTWKGLLEAWPRKRLDIDASIIKKMKRRIRTAQQLIDLSTAEHAELTMLPETHPDLYEYVRTRGYQLADIAFMALAAHPLNTNEPGTGKTIETIATVYEAGYDEAPVLVVAPKTALAPVWLQELSTWLYGTGVPAGTITGQGDPLWRLEEAALDGGPGWVVANPEAIKFRTNGTELAPPQKYEWIYDVDWGVVIFDEFHRMGLNNDDTLAFQSFTKLKADKKIALSGTPMGGQPLKLWPMLKLLYPDEFGSKWAFAANWLYIIDENGYKKIGDVRKERRDEFTQMIASYSTRRIKTEIMKWLPPKQYVEHYVQMTPKQAKQYEEWEREGEIEIDEETLSGLNVLSIYTRLRQFAGAVQRVEVGKDGSIQLYPTEDSCKLPALMDILEERGIGDPDVEVTNPVIVFSQFTRMIDMVEGYLNKKGIKTAKITGAVKPAKRTQEIKDFQSGKVDVFLMNTNAGGVAITLDRADTVVFLDETWNPDDQTQAEDRAHRGSKDRQVVVYKIITEGTKEEEIFRGNITKESINQRVLNNRKRSES